MAKREPPSLFRMCLKRRISRRRMLKNEKYPTRHAATKRKQRSKKGWVPINKKKKSTPGSGENRTWISWRKHMYSANLIGVLQKTGASQTNTPWGKHTCSYTAAYTCTRFTQNPSMPRLPQISQNPLTQHEEQK